VTVLRELLAWLQHESITVAGYPLPWIEVVGNLFGFASAILGMRRKVWAWPIGIVGNLLLFTIFVSATFDPSGKSVVIILRSYPTGAAAGEQIAVFGDEHLRIGAVKLLGDDDLTCEPGHLGERSEFWELHFSSFHEIGASCTYCTLAP